ncbi:MAG TPA: hypothetical protein VGR81_12815 [Candidatus Acidoferrales bacterium]|nr:hypothetical protein [Candidatus Acidoferrales bacterium]
MSEFRDISTDTQSADQGADDFRSATLLPLLMSAYGLAATLAYREILRFLIMARVLGC